MNVLILAFYPSGGKDYMDVVQAILQGERESRGEGQHTQVVSETEGKMTGITCKLL